MVINLAKWRLEKARDLLIKTTYDLVDKLNDPDQDALNYCFHKKYIRLDYVWNAISPFFKETHTPPGHSRDVKAISTLEYKLLQALRFYLQCVAKTEWRGFEPIGFSAKNFFKKQIINTFGEYRVGRAMTMFKRMRFLSQ